MRIFDLKKFRFLIIAALVLILALFTGGFLRKELARQKQEKFNICLESLATSSREEIAEKIGIMSSQRLSGVIEIQKLFARYLACRFNWFTAPEILEKYSNLLEITNVSQGSITSFENSMNDILLWRREFYTIYKKWMNMPLNYLLVEDFPIDDLCPNGQLDEDLFIIMKTGHQIFNPSFSLEKIRTHADAFCPSLERYKDAPLLFKNEILEKKDWPDDLVERKLAFRLYLYLAVRFADENSVTVPDFCQTLPMRQEIEECQNHWKLLFSGKKIGKHVIKSLDERYPSLRECNQVLINIRQNICAFD